MRIILAFEESGCYDGIVTSFRRDPSVVGCTLDHLQQLVQKEDDLLAVMNIDSSQPSANRTKRPDPKQPSDDKPPPNNTMTVFDLVLNSSKWAVSVMFVSTETNSI
jgi:hypothetical protein